MTASAFSEPVFNDNANSEMLESSKNTFVVLRLNAKKTKAQRSFNEVKDNIRATLAAEIAKKTIKTLSQKIVTLLESGQNTQAESLISSNDLTWRVIESTTRHTDADNSSIITQAFALKKPTSQPTYQASFDEDTATIIKLLKVTTPSIQTKDTNTLKVKMQTEQSDAVFNSILQFLKDKAEIQLF
jgi:peptidyl-prolyl cis-trans isomerase D